MSIINPEKECKKTPEHFSDVSKIVNLEKQDIKSGIIFDSPEELADGLRVYGGALEIEGSEETQKVLKESIGHKGGSLAGILIDILSDKVKNSGFLDNLNREVISDLKSNGRFYRSYDYTFNKFDHTSVTARKEGKKYILELCAAYVGSKPEEDLANVLGTQLAIVSSRGIGRLSVVDDWWFNINLEDILQGLPISKKQINGLAEYIASGGYSGERPEISFEHQGQKFSLNINLDADKYLRPEGGNFGSEYIQARGKSIVGGAWTTWAENGNDKCSPRIVQPGIILSVSLYGKEYSKPVAVTEEQMKAVQNARNYLAEIIKPK